MFYIEAYYANGSPMLGNLDGQAALRCRSYKRTKHYRFLRDGKLRSPRVAYYKVVDGYGRVLETITNQ
jgi:hypothetical protein